MRELIDKLEVGIKEEFKKRGFGWLVWGLTIGFAVLNGVLNIFFGSRKDSKTKEKKVENKRIVKEKADDIQRGDIFKKENTPKNERPKPREEVTLITLLKNKGFAWFLFAVSFVLTFIENFLKMDTLVGGWHIVLYLITLLPLLYLSFTNQTKNRHLKWFFPALLVMIFDMFYYNNNFVQSVVPMVFYALVVLLYTTSMHNVHSLYQTLLPKLGWGFDVIDYLTAFLKNLFVREEHKPIYGRIALAILITLPFLGVFMALLFSADTNFGNFIESILSFDIEFNPKYILTVPLYLFAYLIFYIYMFSNIKERSHKGESKPLDTLIVGIFLGMINLLFITFISLQMPFLFGGEYLTEGTSIADFARDGFFQLMTVMGIVLLIFLFIMRRFKGEKITTLMLTGLLIETIMMGVVSIKKMYLYQSIKGATVMRYYVEWFDYFLLLILLLGIWFIIRKIEFSKLLNVTAILGMLSFTTIISLNVDAMVATNNIEKFKDNMDTLDKKALSNLSIDALPSVSKYKIIVDSNRTNTWYKEAERKECKGFAEYHIGYCRILKEYGEYFN